MPPAVSQGELAGRPLDGAARRAVFVDGAHRTVCGHEKWSCAPAGRSAFDSHFVAGVSFLVCVP